MAHSADSIKKYREILELDPSSRVFAMLAEELCTADEWEEAAQVCRKGLIFHPDHLVAQMLLGRALMEMGDPDESERVLLNAVEEIRKNSIIFKLLSELAAMSGITESSSRYDRIYEAFHNTAPAQPPDWEAEGPGSFPEPQKEASEWEDFKSEAIEDLDVDAADVQEELAVGRKIGFADILERLAQGFSGRLTTIAAPEAILSENDRDMLKEKIISLLEV